MALRQPLSAVLQATKLATGAINRGAINLMYLFEPQFRNQFEVMFIPQYTRRLSHNPLDLITSAFNQPAETAITSFNLQSINVPQIGFEYERRQEKRFIKDIVHPDNVVMTFIEEERGFVKAFIAGWIKDIVTRLPDGSYVFMDNQQQSKKDAIITLKGGLGAPSALQLGGWIKLEGLKFESVDEQSLEQSAGDAQMFSVTFSLDNAWYVSL